VFEKNLIRRAVETDSVRAGDVSCTRRGDGEVFFDVFGDNFLNF